MFSSLPQRYRQASSAAGFIIHLGHVFKESGVSAIRRDVYPFVKSALRGLCHPRVLMGYAVMLWFTDQVCINKQQYCCYSNCIATWGKFDSLAVRLNPFFFLARENLL